MSEIAEPSEPTTEPNAEPTGLGGGVVPTEPTTEPSSNESGYSEFYENLPDELKANTTLQNTKSFESLADQLVNAQKALGSKRLSAPQEDWEAKDWDDFYAQLRPADDEYSIPDEFSFEGAENAPEISDEENQEFVDFAADMGLNQQQFDKLYERYMGMAVEGTRLNEESIKATVTENQQAISQEWGNNYDTNLAQANQAYEAMTSEIPELRALVESDPIVANHPAVLKLFHRISEVSGDTLPITGNNPASGFASENVHGVKSAIQELDERNSSLIMQDPSSLSMAERTKRQEVLDKRANLYGKLYPSS